jgi:predicted nucleic acid-binding protein
VNSEKVFIDTSGFYALMDRSDNHHEKAANIWLMLLNQDQHLTTSNYIIVETMALLQNRLGFEAADLWYRDILSLIEILWVESSTHNLAHELWLSFGRRKLSFVDCVSFSMLRNHHINNVFAFDKHFAEQGFELY